MRNGLKSAETVRNQPIDVGNEGVLEKSSRHVRNSCWIQTRETNLDISTRAHEYRYDLLGSGCQVPIL